MEHIYISAFLINSVLGPVSYKHLGDNVDVLSPFLQEGEGQECEVQDQEEGPWTGSSDEDTVEEELYECKVEVKQQNTAVSGGGGTRRICDPMPHVRALPEGRQTESSISTNWLYLRLTA